MPGEILLQLRAALRELGISFREVQHEPTFTSEESAKARGEDLKVGAKALLLRYDEQFGNFVLPADRQLDSVAVKQHLQVKRLRFATAEEAASVDWVGARVAASIRPSDLSIRAVRRRLAGCRYRPHRVQRWIADGIDRDVGR
jgi:hypothetical protein